MQRWPVWRAPSDIAADGDGAGYGGLARFVSVEDLQGSRVSRVFRVKDPAWELRQQNSDLVERLFESLASYRIRYDTAPPHLAGRGQPIRNPAWVAAPDEAGTCIDIALLFAAMCRREALAPYLLMLRSPRRAHVLVAVDLERPEGNLGSSYRPAGCDPMQSGLYHVLNREALLNDDRLRIFDCTVATAGERRPEWSEALTNAADHLNAATYPEAHILDVVARHIAGDEPLGPSENKGSLRMRLPSATNEHRPYHTGMLGRLQAAQGTIVLVGDQGVGKTELARQLAQRIDQGSGWWLDATTKSTLAGSLSHAELFERGEMSDEGKGPGLDEADRSALASAAAERLRSSRLPWAVVFDNANDKIDSLRGLLPVPGPGQLVVLTTTNRAWLERPLPAWLVGRDIKLEPVGHLTLDEITAAERGGLFDDVLLKYIDGRPLFVRAFKAAMRYLQLSSSQLAECLDTFADVVPGLTSEGDRAADALWRVLRNDGRLHGSLSAATYLAWLPPDRTPWEVVRKLAGCDDKALTALVECGWCTTTDGEAVLSVHRLLAEAVRSHPETDGHGTVSHMLGEQYAIDLLSSYADRSLVQAIAAALRSGSPTTSADRRGRARALCAVGGLQELHNDVGASAATYTKALADLDQQDPDDWDLIAVCQHGRAREVNQRYTEDKTKVEEAIEWIDQAIGLRRQRASTTGIDQEVEISTHEAIRALITYKHASKDRQLGRAQQVNIIAEQAQVLRQSLELRASRLGEDDRLTDRARFNLAGPELLLARFEEDRERALAHLDVVEDTYHRTFEFRKHRYADPSTITEVSRWGIALGKYYRAVLDPRADRDTLLAEAAERAFTSAENRRRIEGVDGPETEKSMRLLAKIAWLRSYITTKDARLRDVLREVAEEFPASEDQLWLQAVLAEDAQAND